MMISRNVLNLRSFLLFFSTAALAASVSAQASVTGSLAFDYNSHFISYGDDVWGTGDDLGEPTFNPSVGVTLDLGNGLGFYTGAWMDINNKAKSAIGGTLQELDLWVGGYYTVGAFTVDVAVQQWIYGGDVEEIFDLAFKYDTTEMLGFNISPAFKIHHRFDGAGETGTVLEGSVGYGIEVSDAFSLSIPAAVGYALDDKYYDANGDSGLAYLMTGVKFVYALPGSETFGAWDIHGGLLVYHTPDDVNTGNPEETFLTFTLGTGLAW